MFIFENISWLEYIITIIVTTLIVVLGKWWKFGLYEEVIKKDNKAVELIFNWAMLMIPITLIFMLGLAFHTYLYILIFILIRKVLRDELHLKNRNLCLVTTQIIISSYLILLNFIEENIFTSFALVFLIYMNCKLVSNYSLKPSFLHNNKSKYNNAVDMLTKLNALEKQKLENFLLDQNLLKLYKLRFIEKQSLNIMENELSIDRKRLVEKLDLIDISIKTFCYQNNSYK